MWEKNHIINTEDVKMIDDKVKGECSNVYGIIFKYGKWEMPLDIG